MPKLSVALGKGLKRLVGSSDASQRDIAKSLGLTEQTLSNYVNGHGKISSKTVAKFAQYFGVEETDLFLIEKGAEQVQLSKGHWQELEKLIEKARQPQPEPQPRSNIPEDILKALETADSGQIDMVRLALFNDIQAPAIEEPTSASKNHRKKA